MTRLVRFTFVAFILAAATPWGAPPPVIPSLVGRGAISGDALDKSGLTGNICQAGAPATCVPKAIFGGLGSDITYTGHDNVFIAAPDRGPFDGLTDVPFLDRVHFLHVTVNVGAAFPNISTKLLDTRFLKNEFDQTFVGAAGAFDVNNAFATLRLDPEGIRVGPNGNFYISDEYGPTSSSSIVRGTWSAGSTCLQRFSSPTRAAIRLRNCWATRQADRRIAAWKDWPSAPTAARSLE